jgi:hypothetical protein
MMKNIMMFLAAALVAASACQKVEPLTNDTEQIVYVTAEAGIHSFGVTAQGDWSVVMDEDAKRWCEFEGPSYGSGQGAFSIKYDANLFEGVRRGLRRQAKFTVLTDDKFTSVTILFRQSGLAPHFEFRQDAYEIYANETEAAIAINSNLSVYEVPQISYSVEGNWISGSSLSPNGSEVMVYCSANSAGAPRNATIKISYTDCWGETFTDTATITQSDKVQTPEVTE